MSHLEPADDHIDASETSRQSKPSASQSPVRTPTLGRLGLLHLLTLFVAVATVVLHLMGEELHRAYLKYWYLDAGLFPKTTDWLLIYGYHGSMHVITEALVLAWRHLVWFPLIVVCFAAYLWLLVKPLSLNGAGAWRARLPPPLFRALAWLASSALLLVGLVSTVVLVLIVALVPAVLAQHAGVRMAMREADDFQRGCEQSKAACVLVRKEGRALAKGYILESSVTHIALFDADLRRAIALPREGTDTLSLRELPPR